MTLTVTEDVINGSSFALTPAGAVATRTWIVETTAGESLIDILGAAGIPAYYEPYPGMTGSNWEYSPIFAVEINVQPEQDDSGVYRVTVNYAIPDYSQAPPSTNATDATIQVGSSVSETTTMVDNLGDQIFVTLAGQPTQTGEVAIQTPQTVLQFERREPTSPLTNSETYSGTVNDDVVGGFAARTLLCLGIEGNSTDQGVTWNVIYRFQVNRNTWQATVVYIDPETDRPHVDVNIATSAGVTYANIYPETDFSALSLPW